MTVLLSISIPLDHNFRHTNAIVESVTVQIGRMRNEKPAFRRDRIAGRSGEGLVDQLDSAEITDLAMVLARFAAS